MFFFRILFPTNNFILILSVYRKPRSRKIFCEDAPNVNNNAAYIDPDAKCKPSVSVGKDSNIRQGVRFRNEDIIGAFFTVGDWTIIGFRISIGRHVRVGRHEYIYLYIFVPKVVSKFRKISKSVIVPVTCQWENDRMLFDRCQMQNVFRRRKTERQTSKTQIFSYYVRLNFTSTDLFQQCCWWYNIK